MMKEARALTTRIGQLVGGEGVPSVWQLAVGRHDQRIWGFQTCYSMSWRKLAMHLVKYLGSQTGAPREPVLHFWAPKSLCWPVYIRFALTFYGPPLPPSPHATPLCSTQTLFALDSDLAVTFPAKRISRVLERRQAVTLGTSLIHVSCQQHPPWPLSFKSFQEPFSFLPS